MFFVSNLLQQVLKTVVSLVPIGPVDSVLQSVFGAVIGLLRNLNL